MKKTIFLLVFLFTLSCVNTDLPPEKSISPMGPLGKSVIIHFPKPSDKVLRYKDQLNIPCNEYYRFLIDLDTGKPLPENQTENKNWEFSTFFNGNDIGFTNIEINYPNSLSLYPGFSCYDTSNKRIRKPYIGNVLCTLVAKNFNDVLEAPDPKSGVYNTRRAVDGTIIDVIKEHKIKNYYDSGYQDDGIDKAGDKGEIGFYKRHIVPMDGSIPELRDNNKNTICALFPNRTFIFKTSEGKFAKMEILGIYKNCIRFYDFDMFKGGEEIGYLTIRYFVQKDGSRNLNHLK